VNLFRARKRRERRTAGSSDNFEEQKGLPQGKTNNSLIGEKGENVIKPHKQTTIAANHMGGKDGG